MNGSMEPDAASSAWRPSALLPLSSGLSARHQHNPMRRACRLLNRSRSFQSFSAEMVRTTGTTIHVLREGAGRPLLLLHEYPETHVTWHRVAPELAERFSVVPDLRGYGDSGKPQSGERHENYSFRAMAQDQVDVMQHYGHERFINSCSNFLVEELPPRQIGPMMVRSTRSPVRAFRTRAHRS
jgi:hypothetical protein